MTKVGIDRNQQVSAERLGGVLNQYFENLIARYKSARERLSSLLACETEVADAAIAEADNELTEAFEAIMQAEAHVPIQVLSRMQFIVELINERCEDEEIIKRMTVLMIDDVSRLAAEQDSNNPDIPQRSL